jgi:primosomal protein N' (replication factor Y)
MDKDTVKTVNDIDALLTDFKKNGDILLGTQLIAKGHDIPSVNIVGVLGIDTTLNLPDFRAAEQTFQLLTQVAGRAGRSQKRGAVYVQTLQPAHYVFKHAQTHDTLGFFDNEIQFREMLHYPPYCTLINLIISSERLPDAQKYAETYHQTITKKLSTVKDLIIMPVKPCPFEKIRNHFRFHIVLKCPFQDEEEIKEILNTLSPPPKSIRLITDFDAWQLL